MHWKVNFQIRFIASVLHCHYCVFTIKARVNSTPETVQWLQLIFVLSPNIFSHFCKMNYSLFLFGRWKKKGKKCGWGHLTILRLIESAPFAKPQMISRRWPSASVTCFIDISLKLFIKRKAVLIILYRDNNSPESQYQSAQYLDCVHDF